jgi:threonine dehydratase
MTELVSLADIQDAADRLRGIVRPTGTTSIESVDVLCGVAVRMKEEQRQRTGSFKVRGAYNHISRLPRGSRVVAASAGNHAQGVALAASLSGMAATIFMPTTASLPKVKATQDYGATVRFSDGVIDDAVREAKAYADAEGAVFVPPFDDALVIAGQGTVGLELVAEAPDATTVVIPVGGGGLVAGVGAAYKAIAPQVQVIGVEAAGAASMQASLAAGAVRSITSLSTIADGIAVKSPSELTLAHAQAFVDEVVTVTDEELASAMKWLFHEAKIVAEPSGAATVAAALRMTEPDTVAVVSGGNVDPDAFAGYIR